MLHAVVPSAGSHNDLLTHMYRDRPTDLLTETTSTPACITSCSRREWWSPFFFCPVLVCVEEAVDGVSLVHLHRGIHAVPPPPTFLNFLLLDQSQKQTRFIAIILL